jgi:hypothetical protein
MRSPCLRLVQILLLCCLHCRLASGSTPTSESSDVEALITELCEVNTPAAGPHGTAWASEFMALGEAPVFAGGMLGSSRPATHPAMRRLVQLGATALPGLLAHLEDARETKLVVLHDFMMGSMWHAHEYDPRVKESPYQQPIELSPVRQQTGSLKSYTVRVGDVCYVLVGQIVNRQLAAVRYQPSACIVINSPVESPELAAACRKDWQGATVKDLEQALLVEAERDSMYFGALKRLCYYYPETGKKEAQRLAGLSGSPVDKTRMLKAVATVEARLAERAPKPEITYDPTAARSSGAGAPRP